MMTLVPSHVDAHDTLNVAAVSTFGFQTKSAPIVYLSQVIPWGARTEEESRRAKITIVDAGANRYRNTEVPFWGPRKFMLA